MLKKERQAYILHQIDLHNKVLSIDLSQKINVSEDTIRRDLNELAEMGKIIKVHGGALSRSFRSSLQNEQIYSFEHKKTIAKKAVSLIEDGMFILTSGGTTVVELARSLPEGLKATFITGSLHAALEYMHHPTINVIIIGDRLSKTSGITVGGEAISRISQFHADLCFLGTNAIDIQHGLTDNDWEVAQLKKAMIQSSKKVVTLAISEKLDTVQPIQVCPIEKVDKLITELNPDSDQLEPYRKAGIPLL